MNISNKTLTVLLLAAIVVSLGGTFINLNRLSAITPTGYAPENASGTVALELGEVISITTEDNSAIDFGLCTLEPGQPLTINSEGLGNTSCEGFEGLMTPIFVRNDGTVPVTVDIESDKIGGPESDFLTNQSQPPSQNASISYRTLDIGDNREEKDYSGGCVGVLGADTYAVIDSKDPGTPFSICDNLQTHSTANSVAVHFEIFIPENTIQGDTVTLTFVGAKLD